MSDKLPTIEIHGLTKSYDEAGRRHSIFRDLDVHVQAGEIVAILGRSGSGKSTLLNLISGIDAPDVGEIRVDGADLSRLTERDRTLFRRRHIGFIFQFFNLIPTLDVRDNLLLPLELNGRLDAAGRTRAETLLREVGLAERARAFPDRLSGGEQQRVAIARALVHGPSLLLADEPTGNLDSATSAQILALLSRLLRETRMTALIVTHSREVMAIATRVLELRDGRLHEVPPGEAP